MIPTMQIGPLSLRVVALSWAASLVAWPLVWLALACSQGIGTMLAGGGWIGVAVPLGAHPLGIVNEPTVAFAASRAALALYWLAPPLAALALAVLLPTVVPVPHGWLSEVFAFQFAAAAATLGLGWAAPLGVADGPAGGLERFWGVPPAAFVAASTVAGAAAIQLAVARLNGHLWSMSGGPLRSRRVLAALAHAVPPGACWLALATALGWGLPPATLATMAVVLAGALVGGWVWTPHAPLRLRGVFGWGRVLAVAALGCVALAAAAWAGGSRHGHPIALEWGAERETSNVRPGMTEVRLTPHPVRRTPPAS